MQTTQRSTLNPAGAPAPIGAYSVVVEARCGHLAFIAGQVALDADGHLVGPGDAEAQTRQVFHNLGKALEGVGASFGNVLEFTTYLVGRAALQPFLQARTEIFSAIYPSKDYPANTLLIIDGLVSEDLLVEIKAVAALP